MKKLINVLSAIEKDLRIIASSTESHIVTKKYIDPITGKEHEEKFVPEDSSEISRDSKKINVTVETKNNGSNKLMSVNELINLIRESDGTELITLKVLTN